MIRLLSPLDVPVYILELPPVKPRLIRETIEKLLNSLYPGDPTDREFDYVLYGKKKGAAGTSGRAALVFAAGKKVLESYRGRGEVLIPGTALLSRVIAGKKGGPSLSMLFTENWIEAARFTGNEITAHVSLPWGQVSPELIATLRAGLNDAPRLPVTVILKDPPPDHESFLSSLAGHFDSIRTVDFKDIVSGVDKRKDAVFARKGQRRVNHAFFILLLIILNCGLIYSSLRSLSAKTTESLSRLNEMYSRETRAIAEAESYIGRINAARYDKRGSPPAKRTKPCRIIAQLQSCLNGAWVRTLSVQESGFNLEAEGADSFAVLSALRSSPHFTGIKLHQAFPSKIRGEQFTISGSIVHEEE